MTDERTTNREPHDLEDDGNGNGVIIGVVVGVSILLSGVLGVGLLTGADETPPIAASTTVVLVEETPQIPVVSVAPPERIDPLLTTWNEEHGPTIGKLLAVLAAPPVRDMTLMRFRCKQMLEPLGTLENVSPPPNETVAEAFDLWLLAVRDAVSFCLTGSQELSATDALPVTGSNLGSTGMFWDAFFQEMSRHVDLTGRPGGTAPTLP